MRKPKGKILVVDDDPEFLSLLSSQLNEKRLSCVAVKNRTEMLSALERYTFDGVLLDLMIDGEESLELIPQVLRQQSFCCLIVMTANGSIPCAVDAMEKGATTFLSKSDGLEKLIAELEVRLDFKRQSYKANSPDSYHGILGKSEPMAELIEKIELIKEAEANVLVLGESGTGKELVARALHYASSRKDQVFESINCAAIPEALLEADLFGHEKGSFTGAHQARKGMFEVCDKGTLFLDEIGDMPLGLQAKLLRVLQEKEVRPLGASSSRPVNTRVIAATHADLPQLVKDKRFREDLYFRLSILPLRIPPLRERRGDIALLAQTFLDKFRKFYKKPVEDLTPRQTQQLTLGDWPGNIRQLRNAIERAVLLSRDEKVHLRDLLTEETPTKEEALSPYDSEIYKEARENFEKIYLTRIMTLAQGNVSEAARISGRFRSDLYRQLEKLGMDAASFKVEGQAAL